MADESTNENAAEQAEDSSQAGVGARVARLLRWAGESKLRLGLVGSLCIIVLGGVFATWSYLAHLAVTEEEKFTLAKALVALDQRDYEQAKTIIGEMQRQGGDTREFGGALYVLGAVKVAQAELEWSKDRQRAMHLIAARYLQKARVLGVPKHLDTRALFLLGRSLVLGNQPQDGIEALKQALRDKNLPTNEIHALLTEAYQSITNPDWAAALEHNQLVLDEATLDPQQRNVASITQAEILGQMGRLEDAKQHLKLEGGSDAQRAIVKRLSGQLAIAQAERLPVGSEQRTALAEQAREELREAQLLDPLSSVLTRQSMYWIGKSFEVEGNLAAAIQQYNLLGRSYGDTAESMTAMLAKADLAREANNTEQALAGYRSVLSSISDPITYVNRLLPLSALQKRLLRAYNDFVDTEKFEEAIVLVDALQPVFRLRETTELLALTHEKWAKAKFAEATQVSHKNAEEYFNKGRYHYRAAGAAYELLSELRYASREFTADLWRAADNYSQGQSYSHAEQMLEKYLHFEALEKQALTLLRLGQAQIAQGKNTDAIETLEECIEMHPGDAVIYQARLDCAHAHLQLDRGKRAEELLLANLTGGNLEPIAPEWRDSLFLLGEYLHNSDQHYEAIKKLDEAVYRYPNAPQTLLARYTIARSYHIASEKPARLAQEAKTESERQKNRKRRDNNLNQALQNYQEVQRELTLQSQVDSNELDRTVLRNCYMMQGSVLFQLKRYGEARKAYANISTLFQNEPFVLESFVHIANCYRRLNKPVKAKGTIEQAKLVLNRLPTDTDFKLTTNFSRQSWELLLNEMSQW